MLALVMSCSSLNMGRPFAAYVRGHNRFWTGGTQLMNHLEALQGVVQVKVPESKTTQVQNNSGQSDVPALDGIHVKVSLKQSLYHRCQHQ